MANDNQIIVELVMDDGSVKKAFLKVNEEAKKQGPETGESLAKSVGSTFVPSMAKIGAAAAAAVATAFAAISFRKALGEAIESERAITSLNVALRNAGQSVETASARFTQFSKELSILKGIDDDLINQNAALLVSIGRLSGQGLERATKAAIDLSKGLNLDLNTAFELVAKSAAGNTGALGRYGIKIDENIPKSEKFAAALRLIERNFGGISDSLANNTFEGALSKLSVSFNNLLESFGKLFTNSPVIRETIKIIAEGFTSIGKTLDKLDGQDVVGQIIIRLAELARFINDLISPAIEAFVNLFVTGFKTIKLGLDGLALGVSGISKLLIEAIVFPLRDIALLGGKLVSVFDKEVGQKLKDSIVGVATDLTKPLQDEFAKNQKIFSGTFDSLSASAENAFNTEISQSIDTFLANYLQRVIAAEAINKKLKESNKDVAKEAKLDFGDLGVTFGLVMNGMEDAATNFRKNAGENFKNLGKQAFQSIGQGVGQAFAAFGKAIQQGKDAVSAFGEAMVSAFGNVLVQLGTGYILQGIAMTFAKDPSGLGLISAGAALAAFGGLISASVGGSTSSAGVGGGVASTAGGGVATVPGETTSIADNSNAPQGPSTQIAVNVQGNILDRRQTGLELVEVISEAFEQQGATLIGAV